MGERRLITATCCRMSRPRCKCWTFPSAGTTSRDRGSQRKPERAVTKNAGRLRHRRDRRGGCRIGRRQAARAIRPVVPILEARERIGGRAQTRIANGFPLDLGCGWLHSADRNPWTRIAAELGFTIDKTAPVWTRQSLDLDSAGKTRLRSPPLRTRFTPASTPPSRRGRFSCGRLLEPDPLERSARRRERLHERSRTRLHLGQGLEAL